MSDQSFQDRCKDVFQQAAGEDNNMSKNELYKLLLANGLDANDANEFFEEFDANDDDKISFEEFFNAIDKMSPTKVKKADLRKAFNEMQQGTPDDWITKDELTAFLASTDPDLDVGECLDYLDANDDDKICFQEFLEYWEKEQAQK